MRETSARLLRLLSLLQTRREWPGSELAERLDITPRTVRRDVDKLRLLGYPVRSSSGVTGGYQLEAGTAMPPLLLDDEEAVAVAVGLRTAAGLTVSGIAESSVRALAKLDQVLPPRLRSQVSDLAAMTIPLAGAGPTVDPSVLSDVARACRDQQQLRFDYASADGTQTYRRCEPHRLVHTGRRWYLVGFDLDRADWRTFRMDRLTPKVPIGPRFSPREPPADVAAHTSYGISTGVYRYRARVTMQAPAAAVTAVVSPASMMVESLDETSCLLTAGANDLDPLAIYFAVLGHPFVVHEPPELVEHVRVLGERLIAAGA